MNKENLEQPETSGNNAVIVSKLIVALHFQLNEVNVRNLELEAQGVEMREALYQCQFYASTGLLQDSFVRVKSIVESVLKSTTLGAKLVEEVERLKKEKDVEAARWQQSIYEALCAAMKIIGVPESVIDGAGCDSGDPLDFTLTEINIALAQYQYRVKFAEGHLTTTQQKLAAAINALELSKVAVTPYSPNFCPCCDKAQNNGHRPDCALAAVLKDADASGWVHVDGELVKAMEETLMMAHSAGGMSVGPRKEWVIELWKKAELNLNQLRFIRSTSTQGTK